METFTRSTAVIVDEGFAHRAIGLFAYGYRDSEEEALRRFADLMPPLNVAVYLSADPETAANRSRPNTRLGSLDRSELVQFHRDAQQVLLVVMDQLVKRGVEIVEMTPDEAGRWRSEDHDRLGASFRDIATDQSLGE